MHIGILTGGGDVPGLNAVIKKVVNLAAAQNHKVTGFRRGWAGPLNYNPDDPDGSQRWLMALNTQNVRGIDRTGGTILHSSRTNPAKVKKGELPAFLQNGNASDEEAQTVDATAHILSVLQALKFDVLIAIGGDDTLSYAARLHEEGVPTLCIPKTMDNDVYGTDYCIGFSTCVSRSVELITRLRSPAGSHERILFVELFGRHSGESALITGYLCSADRVLIPEVPIDLDSVADFLAADRAANPSNYAVCLVSEGAMLKDGERIESGEADAYGHKKLGGIGSQVAAAVLKRTGIKNMQQNLAYLVRAGAPDALDLMVAKNYAAMAMQQIEKRQFGLMMALHDGRYCTRPANISTQGVRAADVKNLYDLATYRPHINAVEGLPMFLS